ncbi:MAG: alpha/beta fold hydrolase, partial [Terriglobus roseus]|nr:alpha/beta fold hydrolase [Terriglobus roseus]
AGVGFGFEPPKWLRPGDEVRIEVTGLGELVNPVGDPRGVNPTVERVRVESDSENLPIFNANRASPLTTLPGGKQLYYKRSGKPSGQPVVFIHGLGGSSEYFSPLLALLEPHCDCHVFDLEGHGLSPTAALSTLSIGSFARDLDGVIQHAGGLKNLTLVAHSMGCLVALKYAIANTEVVAQLVLMGPPPSPLPEAAAANNIARAQLVREKGMPGCVDAVVGAGLSEVSRKNRPMAVAATRLSLLGTDREGYAKACTALAGSQGETLDVGRLKGVKILLLTGSEDKVCPGAVAERYREAVGESLKVEMLEGVGHWHLFEDVEGVRRAVAGALGVK